MNYQGFIGSTDTLRSPNVNAERTINWYFEPGTPGTPKQPAWLVATPGVFPFLVLGDGPVRQLFSQDGRMFAVGGIQFAEVFPSKTGAFRGTVAVDSRPASISSNGTAGNQLFVTSGGLGYIYDLVANTLTQIADPGLLLPTAMGTFIDGFFLSLHEGTRQFQISALEDGTMWDPTDVSEVSQSSDNLVAMVANHRELWLFGSRTTEVWTNLGDPLNPFQPIPGAFLQQGILGPWCWTVMDNTVYWIGQNAQGQGMVYRASGYSLERVSSSAIEFRLSQYKNLEQSIIWSYQQNGHSFLVIYPPNPGDVPGGPVSFTFDASTGQWHERALWDPRLTEEWQQHPGRCVCNAFDRILVGDRQSPAIYEMDLDIHTDTIVNVGN